jgi:outer membrane protein assembly factor BamB
MTGVKDAMSATVLDIPGKRLAPRKRVAKMFLAFFVLMILIAGILLTLVFFTEERRQGKAISNFTLVENSVYFGGGYHLYRLDLSTRSLETVFSADRILVEQPVIADGIAYFGGRGYLSKWGFRSGHDTLFALDLQSRHLRWTLDLGRKGGYGTYGTYPVIAGDRILVCARQHLYCVDRRNGTVLWQVGNWLGDAEGITRPYVFKNFVYYKINEEYFTGRSENDGQWAVIELTSGKRLRVIPIAEKPGTYKDMKGHGSGALIDGVLYGATRYHHFGAIDLKAERVLWEFDGEESGLLQFSQYTPAVNNSLVFTAAGESLYAFDRGSGQVVWEAALGDIIPQHTPPGYAYRPDGAQVHFAATNEVVIAQGYSGVAAWRADTGQWLWSSRVAARSGNADPLILDGTVIVSSSQECRVLALDLQTGKELWSVEVPDCTYYYTVS